MNGKSSMPEQAELKYFGSVTASVTHELKNVLAICNENAGLLSDFVAMAERGRPLDSANVGRIADALARQVARGDEIIRRLNRFAHSVDQSHTLVDLNQTVMLVVNLFARTAANRGVELRVISSEEATEIETQPFALQALLGGLLDNLSRDGKCESIALAVDGAKPGVIRFLCNGNQALFQANAVSSGNLGGLCERLCAKLELDSDHGGLGVILPERMDGSCAR